MRMGVHERVSIITTDIFSQRTSSQRTYHYNGHILTSCPTNEPIFFVARAPSEKEESTVHSECSTTSTSTIPSEREVSTAHSECSTTSTIPSEREVSTVHSEGSTTSTIPSERERDSAPFLFLLIQYSSMSLSSPFLIVISRLGSFFLPAGMQGEGGGREGASARASEGKQEGVG
jgi:hypothetical protein